MEKLFSDLLIISLVSSIVICVASVLYRLLNKRYRTNWRCVVWVALVIRLLIPFNPTLSITEWINPIMISMPKSPPAVALPRNEPEPPSSGGLTLPDNSTVVPPQDAQEKPIVPAPQSSPTVPEIDRIEPEEKPVVWVDLITILSWIWIAGMAVAIGIRTFQLVRFGWFLRRNSIKVLNPNIHKMIKQVRVETDVIKPFQVLRCRYIDSPMIVGLFKTKLVFPMVDYNESELYAILRHELSHIRAHHIAIKAVMLAAEIIHWFNPFVYLMTRMVNKDLELACDARVLRITSQSYGTEYSKAILSAIRRAQQRENVMLHFASGLDSGEPVYSEKREIDMNAEKGNDI